VFVSKILPEGLSVFDNVSQLQGRWESLQKDMMTQVRANKAKSNQSEKNEMCREWERKKDGRILFWTCVIQNQRKGDSYIK